MFRLDGIEHICMYARINSSLWDYSETTYTTVLSQLELMLLMLFLF